MGSGARPDTWSRENSGSLTENRTTITLSSISKLSQCNEYTKLVLILHAS